MASNFKKRLSKEVAVPEVVVPKSEEVVLPQTGYDIYSLDGGGSYNIAEIQYDPTTSLAKVVQTYEVSRMIALSYAGQKTALSILKKQKKQPSRHEND